MANLLLTWQAGEKFNNRDYSSIFIQKFNANGTVAGKQVKLDAASTIISYDGKPEITALGNSGAFVVTWEGEFF